jgi:hypothetical protein
MAILTLTVNNGTDWPSKRVYTLWQREVQLEGVPQAGDMIEDLPTTDEPWGSVTMFVKRRYWRADGRLVVELQDIVYLPTAEFDADFTKRSHAHHQAATDDPGHYYRCLPTTWRPSDGQLPDLLLASGWTPDP